MGSASLLRDMLHVGAAAAREEADEIIKGADRAARLTSQLLAFARGSLGAPRRVDLNHRLKELSHLLRRAVGETHRLEIVTLDNALVAWIDPGQFDQLVMNLVINAKDASSGGKTILVSLAEYKPPNDSAAPPEGADRKLVLRVQDEGSGIPPELVERIFEPFFTTKGERGTGLGLTTCFGIARRAAGSIEVESKPGHGSCFSVILPLVEAALASEITRVIPMPVDVRLGEVLVVDDQDTVLRVVAQTLRAAGAIVHEARSAEEALALWESGERNLDIVISDVLLPRRSGPELVRDLKAHGYAGPVLLISGYMDDEVMIDRITGESLPLLLKPFTALELRDAVGRAMSRGASNALAPDSREKSSG
jgi:two-component system, cell cycle sensor histidine kinase and response regulator CckA